MFGDPLVHAFVTPADQQEFIVGREFACNLLCEFVPLGREQDYFPLWRTFRPDGFDRIEDWFGLQHHAFAAAERAVVYCAVQIVGPLAQVVYLELERTELGGAGDDAVFERAIEEIRKDCEKVKLHAGLAGGIFVGAFAGVLATTSRFSSPSGKSTRMSFASV